MTSTRNVLAARRPSGVLRAVLRAAITVHTGLYRVTRGRVGGSIQGTSLLLLTTTGRKSGRRRTVPLSYFDQGDYLLVVGSAGGQPWEPAWCMNVRDNPHVTVEIRGERREMLAHVADGSERARLWHRFVEAYRLFEDYQRKADRLLPVVQLRPVTRGRSSV